MPKKRHNSGIFFTPSAYKHKKAGFVVLCLRVNIIQLLCQIMTKSGVFGAFGHGVVVLGRGFGYI